MKFVLKIELGNDAMQTPQDVKEALREVIDRLSRRRGFALGDGNFIRDVNGNRVGDWGVDK